VTESLVKNLPPSKLFFSGENQKKIKNNFNTDTHGAS
jgi:hypothetical protein